MAAAYLALQAGASLAAEEVEAYCGERIAAYQVPRRIEVTDAIPEGATAKILKRVLRDAAAGAQPG